MHDLVLLEHCYLFHVSHPFVLPPEASGIIAQPCSQKVAASPNSLSNSWRIPSIHSHVFTKSAPERPDAKRPSPALLSRSALSWLEGHQLFRQSKLVSPPCRRGAASTRDDHLLL